MSLIQWYHLKVMSSRWWCGKGPFSFGVKLYCEIGCNYHRVLPKTQCIPWNVGDVMMHNNVSVGVAGSREAPTIKWGPSQSRCFIDLLKIWWEPGCELVIQMKKAVINSIHISSMQTVLMRLPVKWPKYALRLYAKESRYSKTFNNVFVQLTAPQKGCTF